MTLAVQIIGMFSGLSAFLTLCILLIRPIRERVLGTKDIREGQKCILRADMLRAYYRHRDEDQIRQYEKENFIMEYKAYKALGGNSFIDDIEKEVRRWDVVT
jgi:hypothetical protein